MTNISILEPYLLNREDKDFDNVRKRCELYGVQEAFEKHLSFINCTRWTLDGKFRLIQTIGFPYCKEMTDIVWLVNNMIEDEYKDKAFERIIEQHKKNIAYEVEHPPIWYTNKKYTKKDYQNIIDCKGVLKPKRSRKVKEKYIDGLEKETASERKVKARLAKINSLSLKIKPK